MLDVRSTTSNIWRDAKLTREDAVNAKYRQELYHNRLRNSDGTPLRCRVNGKCKTWVTRPEEFRLPVKYGLRECFYIEPLNADEWLMTEEEAKAKKDPVTA